MSAIRRAFRFLARMITDPAPAAPQDLIAARQIADRGI